MTPDDLSPDRRQLLAAAAALGFGTATFHRAAAAEAARAADDPPKPATPTRVTPEMVKNAEWVAGVTLTDDQREAVAQKLTGTVRALAAGRKVPLPNHVAPAVQFNPAPGLPPYTGPRGTVEVPAGDAAKSTDATDLAFLPVATLAHLVKTRQVSSVELTKLALDRLRRYDPVLKCVVTLTDDLALRQAADADKEIAAGRYRGPLHGIPWAAKDLIAYPGYKTTWGAGHYQNQTLDVKASVAERLEAAGAVLVAKTTLGALAMGDRWFGGMTRNPWNPFEGSSGSSAGSASAVAAGLVPFAIGSETLGSIVSPSTRCGVTGLRPTFGRVSRHGCMTLSWTMDKLGPIARSVEDCALVFGTIHGADGKDPTAVDRPFGWPGKRPLSELRVGYFAGAEDRDEFRVLKESGVKLVKVKLPTDVPAEAIYPVLAAESAAAFDDITQQGVTEGIGAWGTTFREGRFVSAVDYLRANRLRTLLMQKMTELMETVDLYVGGPGNELLITNLTGHPTVCLPNGFTQRPRHPKDDGAALAAAAGPAATAGRGTAKVPTRLTFTGRLYGETDLMAVAHAYQKATGHHFHRPPMGSLG